MAKKVSNPVVVLPKLLPVLEEKVETHGIEVIKVKEITALFQPMINKMEELEVEFEQVMQLELTPENINKFRELRNKYVKTRTGTERIHKDAKSYHLNMGRVCDSWKNVQSALSIDKENILKGKEDYYINLEKERVAKLKEERLGKLAPFMDISTCTGVELMGEDTFEYMLKGAEEAHKLKLAAEEQARKDEEERVRQENIRAEEEAKERARLAEEAEAQRKKNEELEAENKRLAEEQKKKDEAIEAEKKKKEAEEKVFVERLGKLNALGIQLDLNAVKSLPEKGFEQMLDAAQKKKDKEVKEAEEKRQAEEAERTAKAVQKAKEEAEARAKEEAEKARIAAEEKLKAEELARKEAELAKPEDFTGLLADLEAVKVKYSNAFKNEESVKLYAGVCTLLDKVVVWVQDKTK